MGVEPTYPEWKSGVLPMNYTCILVIYIVKLLLYFTTSRINYFPKASFSKIREFVRNLIYITGLVLKK